jgi:sulfatase modifying factor 1
MKTRTLIPVVAVLFTVFTLNSHAQSPLVTIDTVTVGDAGNAADSTGYGAVADVFAIGKYEVTIGQYNTFLNSVASVTSDSYIVNLWNGGMAVDLNIAGISRSGSGTLGDPYTYSVIAPSGITPPGASTPGNRPITYVSWFDAARFANWMHNGATDGASTETGAYTLNGATNGIKIIKNAGATWWIPSEDEWYKAAYYKGGGTNAGYWLYPTQSDSAPGNNIGGAANQANYYEIDYAVTQSGSFYAMQNYLTEAGVFSNSASAYGTFDQAGNVFEWNDAVILGFARGLRGGDWHADDNFLQSSYRTFADPASETFFTGFRVASVSSNASVLPQISSFSHGSNGFAMTWTPASDVHVQRRLDLNGATWTTVLSNVTGTSYLDQATPAGRAFYRLTLP